MYVVVEVGGMQWKVSKSQTIRVPKMDADPGKAVELDRVLLMVDGGNVKIGKPVVPQAVVKATVLSHGKADKVRVFKKKRRKGYRVLKGHRQGFTELRIDKIGVVKAAVGSEKKSAASAPAESKKPAVKKPASSKKDAGATSVSKAADQAVKKPAPKKPASAAASKAGKAAATSKPRASQTAEKKTASGKAASSKK